MVCISVLQIGKQRDLSNIHRATQLLVTDGLGYDHPPSWPILLTASLPFGCLLFV